MSYIVKTMDVEVEIDLDDFSDRELIEELQDRGNYIISKDSIFTKDQERLFHEVYLDYVDGKNLNSSVKKLLDEMYMYVPLRSV